MIYTNAIRVLTESESRMSNQPNLFKFSHRQGGYSYYDLNLSDKSENSNLEFVEKTLIRQGIPATIYPDRLLDNVIFIRFFKSDVKLVRIPYKDFLQLDPINSNINLLEIDEAQLKEGNIFTISQFIKPSKDDNNLL